MPLDHLYAGPILAEHLRGKHFFDKDTVVVSPDVGGVARAQAMAEMLDAGLAIIAKRRPEPNKVEIVEIIGDVRNKTCVMIDDMVDTGSSIVSGACALIDRGARRVVACVTHAILSGPAVEHIEKSPIEEMVVTDTIPISASKASQTGKFTILSVAPLLADAIQRIHQGSSVSALFDNYRQSVLTNAGSGTHNKFK
jgi:ribose-phosphate pyrophosphokinase